MRTIVGIAVTAMALFATLPASAQKADDCAGTIEVIRFSQLRPGKTIEDFRKIADQHIAWYRKHGFTKNQQIVAPVITAAGVSPDRVVTIHLNAPGVTQDQHDAEWERFVDAYREVSTVEAMRTVCLPK
jgi:hypothetical protein